MPSTWSLAKNCRWLALVSVSVVVQLASAAPADVTEWPAFMPTLKPGISLSPVAVVLPAQFVIEPPSPDLPPERARWSGLWGGWACENLQCDTKLIVERVTPVGATIIYSTANAYQLPQDLRGEGAFVGDELGIEFANGPRIAYRMRGDGVLAMYWKTSEMWRAVVLTKER